MGKVNTKKLQKQETIFGKEFDEERALYNLKNALVEKCVFRGLKDGESPFKEARAIKVNNCDFDLRYAFWHVKNADIANVRFSEKARAPFWYDSNVVLNRIDSNCVKIFRECKNLTVSNSVIKSEEPFWKCSNITVNNSKLVGFYSFFECKNVKIEKLEFEGKYSFQYNKHLEIKESVLNTKDAFWHCNDVVVKDSIIKGEYIGWYSKNITFINCTIESHQPFCYCKNIKFVNCKMPNSDLAFENSIVSGTINGEIESIKNPISCVLEVGEVKKIIRENSLHKVDLRISKLK